MNKGEEIKIDTNQTEQTIEINEDKTTKRYNYYPRSKMD